MIMDRPSFIGRLVFFRFRKDDTSYLFKYIKKSTNIDEELVHFSAIVIFKLSIKIGLN
jgi:hypothetical protein